MSDGPPTLILHLPVPPSANRMWRKLPNRKRPIISPEYQQWLTEAGWEARRQLVGVPTIAGRFRAEIHVPHSRRDLDNWAKPLFDLAQRAGAIRNDSGNVGYRVTPHDRDDCAMAFWDLGGEVAAPTVRRRRSVAPHKTKPSTHALGFAARRLGLSPPKGTRP